MKIISVIILLLSSFLIPAPAFSSPYGDAIEAHKYEEYDKAFPMFKQLASKNDASAQFYLGHMYQHGEGVKKSKKKAKQWIMKAAESGDDNARVTLGVMYKDGDGVRSSKQEAFKLFKLASENGHAVGRFHLATMYHWGEGVKQDEQLAFNLYSQVTRMDAWYNHLWGMDRWVPIRAVKAMKDNSGMAETFTQEQAAVRKIEIAEREQYLIDLENETRHKEADEAARIKTALIAAGPIENGWAAYNSKDYLRAFPILLAHAIDGDVEAQTKVGVMYRDGKGVERNDKSAGDWFREAEKGNSGEAYYHHARMTSWGRYYGGHLLPEQLMNKSYYLGYQPAIDDFNRAQAEKDRIAGVQEERLQQEAEEAARRAEYLRQNPRRTITNCDGPRPSDAPPVPAGYYCDRRSGSPTYGDYVKRN